VAIEESGKPGIVTFIGSLTLMGSLQLRQNRFDSAEDWYRRSLSLFVDTDHVYRNAFLALTYCGLGRIEVLRRDFDKALDLYKKAKEAVASGPEGLGMGYMHIKTLLGTGVTFHELGVLQESKTSAEQAEELLDTKKGYDFSWIWEGSDALAYYDLATYYALCNQPDRALQLLSRACERGWADLAQLDAEPFFSGLREHPRLISLREELNQRQPLREHPDF
jgi:tetratricopeptide (TPR) repeat protein